MQRRDWLKSWVSPGKESDGNILICEATLPGAHLVDVFPLLDYLPQFLKPWERAARERFRRDVAFSQERMKVSPAASQRACSLTQWEASEEVDTRGTRSRFDACPSTYRGERTGLRD